MWSPLNPARGDKGPRAGTLWGDRNGTGPTGFLVKFVDGFSSPPHIHNVTYRGVVISGLVHNDDPDAAEMWMPAGSFWTQPAGEIHITAARGDTNIAYIEIDGGPYLVLPTEQAFDRGERPVNVDASNIVWTDPPGMHASEDGPKIAYLWGVPNTDRLNGTMVRLPAGFDGKILSDGSTFRAVVIQGRPQLLIPVAEGEARAEAITPGSYFGSTNQTTHRITCDEKEGCILYVRSEGSYGIMSAHPNH